MLMGGECFVWERNQNFREFRDFRDIRGIDLTSKIENSEILEICLFFQILTVVITQDLETTKNVI